VENDGRKDRKNKRGTERGSVKMRRGNRVGGSKPTVRLPFIILHPHTTTSNRNVARKRRRYAYTTSVTPPSTSPRLLQEPRLEGSTPHSEHAPHATGHDPQVTDTSKRVNDTKKGRRHAETRSRPPSSIFTWQLTKESPRMPETLVPTSKEESDA
jgi:hypothetical protein